MESIALRGDETPFGFRRVAAQIPNVAAVLVILLATVVLSGWCLNLPLLKTVLPGSTSMKANTAVEFLLSGVSLQALRWRRFGTLSYLASLPAIAIALATLAEYAWGRSLGIDEFFFRDVLSPQYPGRMAPVSAGVFVLLGTAMLLQRRRRRFPVIAQALALLAALGPVFGIVGYLYGVPVLYGSIHYTAMAFHTGLGLLVLIVGVLFADPGEGFVRIFLADTSGGILARIVVPASVLVPILLGYIFLRARFNFGEERLAGALTAISSSAVFAALIWTLAFFLESRELQWNRAKRQANVDSLTGVMNRRYFEKSLAREFRQSGTTHEVFSLILFDVDHFKALNDSSGHLAGDQVLCAIARILKNGLRETEIVCRFGGEEFAVIACRTNSNEALQIAERLRAAVEQATYAGLEHVSMTISAGVSTYPVHGTRRGQLLAAADLALYGAKTNGRNRVVAFDSAAPRAKAANP